MKRLLYSISFLIILLVTVASCKKEVTPTVLRVVSFPTTGAFTSTVSSVTITADNNDADVISFSWPAVDYGIETKVTYTLQFDIPSDTMSTGKWGTAQSVVAGVGVLTTTMKGSDLNTIVKTLALEYGVASPVIVRVQAMADRAVYSKVLTLQVQPYKIVVGYPSLWVPGDYQGWDPASAPKIVSVNSDNFYEGYIYIPANGTNAFKFTAQAAWLPTTYGDIGDGLLSKVTEGGNITAPSDGYYELSANLNTMKYTVTKTTWSILGDASPGGWDTDTQLTYDVTAQVWKVTCAMKASGSFKFRANNAWAIDFGIDSNGKLLYVDNPLYTYNSSLSNLTVPVDGTYTIILDLHVPGEYSYKLTKN